MSRRKKDRGSKNEDRTMQLRPCDPKYIRKLPAHLDLAKVVKQDRYTSIDSKLGEIIAASPTPPPWHDAWVHSTRGRNLLADREAEAEPEERLAVWQAVRDSKALPDDAGFFLVADQIAFLTELQIGDAMYQIDQRIDAIWAEFGFEEWRSQGNRDSEDFLAFRERCPLDWDRLYFEMLRKHGEDQMAQLYRADRENFETKLKAGHHYFYPPPPPSSGSKQPMPTWLKKLHAEIAASGCFIIAGSAPAAIEFGYQEKDEWTQVVLCLAPMKMVGGPHDGMVAPRAFEFDVTKLQGIFDTVVLCTWVPFEIDAPAPISTLCMAGHYKGRPLMLQVFGIPTDNIEPISNFGPYPS